MTSKFFYCSRQSALLHAQEVLKELRIHKEIVDSASNSIRAFRSWRFLNPGKEVEITLYSDENRVEVAVNVESTMKALDFGSSEYLEEEILHRLHERIH
jgi:hypothetical protein